MASKLHVQLVTPQRIVMSAEVKSLTCPTLEGLITLLPGHAPLVSTLASGEMTAKTDTEEFYIHVSGGFVQVKPNSEVIILADAAEHHYEIDIDRAEQARQLAEKTLKEQVLSDEEYAIAAHMLQKNLARITVARKHAHRRTNITHEGVFHSND